MIEVDQEKWGNPFKYGPSASGEAHMFSMLAHEVGHNQYNTKDVLFKGGSAEDYVQYRAGLEGHAIFNAFSIFKDLEGDPAFKNNASFNSTGYLNGIELGQMYNQWRSGELNDAAAVERITAKVADTPYWLSTPLTDKNNDGKLTHRDAYLRDYEQVIKQHPKLAKPPELPQESMPNKAPRLRGPASGRATPDEDALDLSHRAQDGDTIVVNRVDPLLEAIWAQLPKGTSREKAEEVKLAAKIGGIERPDQFERIDFKDNDTRAFVRGKFDGFRADVYLATPAPSLQATQQQEQMHDREQALMWERFDQQQARLNQDGPKMSLGGRGSSGSAQGGGSVDS